MIRYSKAVMAAALAAVSSVLMGAGSLPASPPTSVTIYNPGDADFTGYAIAIEPNGQAWSMDGAGRSQSQLPFAVTQAFFTDIAAASPLSGLSARPCATSRSHETNSQANPDIYLVWHGQHSPNLQCATDPRADRLLAEATAIARAMYVQAYRVRAMAPSRGSGSAQYDNQTSTASSGAANGATYAGAGYAATSYDSSAGASSCGCGGYSFGLGGLPMSNLPTSSLPNTGFGNGFSNGSFTNSLHFDNSVFSSRSSFGTGTGLGTLGNSSFSNSRFTNTNSFSGQSTTSGLGSGSLSNSTFSSSNFSYH